MSKKNINSVKDLIEQNLINRDQKKAIDLVAEQFSIGITSQLTHQAKKEKSLGILSQFVPTEDELNIKSNELRDPIGDNRHSPVEGIIHRYPDRCLLKAVNVCPVYCRFCFRKEKVGPGNAALNPQQLENCYNYIRNNPKIWEVILTGGDPLILKPQSLLKIIKELNDIKHVEIIRIHTRVPVVDSARINDELIKVLSYRKPIYIILHSNHPDEFSQEAQVAIAKIIDAGIPMLSQSVLINNLNDNIDTLSKLMRCFVKNRIKPYYLHHGDMAKGTSHFRTSIKTGQRLMNQLRGHFSGICQPDYVLDIPGGYGKSPICASYIQSNKREGYQIKDYQGEIHNYIE